MVSATELLWAFIGLLLTIGGTLLEASVTSPPWHWSQNSIPTHSLGVSYQIGAVLFVGCLGGKNAAALSQIAYLVIGLIWLPVFTQGGGLGYLKEPSFGYLLGFVPGAWICGLLAFRMRPQLESLAFSCLCGLFTIHITGLSFLFLSQSFHWAGTKTVPLLQAVLRYSVYPLVAQLAILCAVTVLAFTLRHLMFY